MKKLSIATLVASMFLVACSQTQSNDTADKAQQTGEEAQSQAAAYPTATIGVAMNAIDGSNSFYKQVYNTIQEIDNKEEALTVMIENADNDQDKQNAQIEALIGKGVKAVVIGLADPDRSVEVIEKYCGPVPLVFFNREPDARALANCKNAYYVTGDSVQAGVLLGLKTLEVWNQNPMWDKNSDGTIQYAMLQGTQGNQQTQKRADWMESTLKSYPNLGKPTQKLFEEYANSKADLAAEVVTKWTEDPNFANVELMLINSDSMMMWANEALKAKNIKVPLFGMGGSDDSIKAAQNGDLSGIVLNDRDAQVHTFIRLAANLAAGQEPLSGIDQKMEHKIILVPYKKLEDIK